jgi:predicted AlkP superfamily pyrophosphatase or phosphodiesterase
MMIKYPDYNHSILNVSATLLKHYGVVSSFETIQTLEESLKKNPKHVVYILLDGMGINLLEKHLKKDAFFNRNLKDTITSVFPPTTVAATNAVLSGKAPISTGYLGWVQYFKKEDTDLAVFMNYDYYHHDRTFDLILRDHYLKYDTILDQIKKRNSDVMTFELFPSFRNPGYHAFCDQIDEALSIMKNNKKTFTYIYWTEPDLSEHDYGISHDLIKDILSHLNDEVERLYQNMPEDAQIIVIADHGLTDVEHIDVTQNEALMSCLERKPSLEPRATTFFVKKGFKKRFKELFNLSYQTDFMLLSKREFLKSGLLGSGKRHPMLKGFIGDFVGIAIGKSMFDFIPGNQFIANHAGLTQDEMDVPLIIITK